MGSLSITGQPGLRQRFIYSGAEVTFIEPNNHAELAVAIVTADTAAVILEPVLGEGGIYPLESSFLQTVRDPTRRTGAYSDCRRSAVRTRTQI